MTVLITGGLGFIGSHTACRLLEEMDDVIIVDRHERPEVIENIEKISKKKVKFEVVDLLNLQDLQNVFIRNKITAVIHFAALKRLSESFENPLLYYRNNILSTLNLLEVMNLNSVKKLIFSSSAIIYGDFEQVPLKEDNPLKANNPYAQTKCMTEKILRDVAVSNPEWSILALRYFNPIGAHQSSLIGETSTIYNNNLMPHILRVATKEQQQLAIYGDCYPTKDGTCIRDYIHIMDLADGHIKALQYIESNEGYDVINLGTGVGTSVLELIHTFSATNRVKIPYIIEEPRVGDIAVSYASVEKAKRLLKWQAKYSLEDMCRDAWKWKVRENAR